MQYLGKAEVRRVLAGAYSPSAGRLRLEKTVRT